MDKPSWIDILYEITSKEPLTAESYQYNFKEWDMDNKVKRGDNVTLLKSTEGIPQGTKGKVMNIMGTSIFVAFNSIPALIEIEMSEARESLKVND